jgi:CRP-like cAMP-binding protein
MIFKEYENADKIVIICKGTCEVFTTMEGNEFVLERLEEGAVINSRAMIIEDLMYVNIRC